MNKSDDKNFEIAMLSGEIASNRHNGASRYVATIQVCSYDIALQ